MVLAASLLLVFSAACKKMETKSDSEIAAELKAKKIADYKSKACNYLFSIDKSQLNAMQPMYFGKTSNGEVKYILTGDNNQSSHNIVNLVDGNVTNWNLPGLDLSKLEWQDFYSLDQQGGLEYESYFVSSSSVYYLERNGALQTRKWTTEIGDSLWIVPASAKSPVNFNGNALTYRHGAFQLDEAFIFKGGLFRYFGYSYFIYTVPKDIMLESVSANLTFMKRSSNGIAFQKSFYSDNVAEILDGKDVSYLEGMDIRLVETGKEDPSFVFLPNRKSASPNRISYWMSGKTEEIKSVSFPFSASELKFFNNADRLFANTKNQLFMVSGDGTTSIPVVLNIDRIKGIFGNSNAILIVVENDEMGLDVVELI